MDTRWVSYFLAGGLSLLVAALLVKLLRPFFQPVAWAVILSFYLFPVNLWLRRKLGDRRALAAVVLIAGVVLFLLLPSGFILTEVTRQALDLVSGLKGLLDRGPQALIPSPEKYPRLYGLLQGLVSRLTPFETQLKQVLAALASETGQFLITQGKSLFRNTVALIFNLVFMLITLFYLFRDGDRFVEEVKELLPGTLEETERMVGKVREVLRAVLFGGLLTGLAQGLAALIIYLLLGLPSAIFLGLLTAAASFVPMVGTALVWIPATLYLLAKASFIKALILLIYSLVVVSQIDSLLRPFIVGSQTEIHTLFLFFSILGGLKAFGVLGVFLGPIVLSLAISLLEIYRLKVVHGAGTA
ncbi:AI-2E family transporter [Thermosulfurimonas marina]|uniref:AI-2E family transporter n=1 Tax=Thermosulfurimonas marina TaxID=2047767 RepID=A0A6H1WTR7_9BACT|nr:AI-2E family transporter [Thermosulfurimonas marina]QJA06603.1 AI-2E family transporter [Thermosulfurimonas marina]